MLRQTPSVIQLAQRGYPSVYPVLLGPVCRKFNGEDVVGGVACGGEGSSPGTCFIHWTHVNVLVQERRTFPRFQPNDGQWVIEDFGERLPELHPYPVPTGTF